MAGVQSIILYSTLFVSLFFEVFLLITYFEVRDEIKFEKDHTLKEPKSFPSVTIIVPSFNEEKTVKATVESLLKLNYPKDKLTLLLIDDGSTDNTLKVLNTFKDNPQVRVFSKQNEGSKFAALNFGLTKTDTDLVGCLDADSFVDPNALKHIVPYFDDKGVMAVTPSIKVHDPKTILQQVQKIEYNWGIFLRRILASIDALYVTPGPFSIFRTQVFRDLGGYKHAHHTEDMEMALRMQKNRYRIVNSLSAHVYTVAPEQLKSLYKQRVRWSYGFLNNAIDYKEMFFNKKYGHIGFFVLPIATLSVFTTMYAASRLIWGATKTVWKSYELHAATNWSLHAPKLNFDWFYWNTSLSAVLGTIAVIFALGMLLLALRTAEGKTRIGKDLVYYLSIYMFIVPLWMGKALYNTIFGRSITWR
jgi:poly-beta-1,6-N-acetyl-D-glucosamine synthase